MIPFDSLEFELLVNKHKSTSNSITDFLNFLSSNNISFYHQFNPDHFLTKDYNNSLVYFDSADIFFNFLLYYNNL